VHSVRLRVALEERSGTPQCRWHLTQHLPPARRISSRRPMASNNSLAFSCSFPRAADQTSDVFREQDMHHLNKPSYRREAGLAAPRPDAKCASKDHSRRRFNLGVVGHWLSGRTSLVLAVHECRCSLAASPASNPPTRLPDCARDKGMTCRLVSQVTMACCRPGRFACAMRQFT
jgi:hypothetical protein